MDNCDVCIDLYCRRIGLCYICDASSSFLSGGKNKLKHSVVCAFKVAHDVFTLRCPRLIHSRTACKLFVRVTANLNVLIFTSWSLLLIIAHLAKLLCAVFLSCLVTTSFASRIVNGASEKCYRLSIIATLLSPVLVAIDISGYFLSLPSVAPQKYWAIRIGLYLFVLSASLCSVALHRNWVKIGYCSRCKYDLRGCASDTNCCPECGEPITSRIGSEAHDLGDRKTPQVG